MKYSRFIILKKIMPCMIAVVALFVPYITYAVTGSGLATQTLSNPLKADSVGAIVQNFVEVFSYVVILFAVLALVYVGLKFILARGNAEEMTKLKEWLFWIVVGVAVVIGARIIVEVVINTLSASGVVNTQVMNSAKNALSGH